MPTLTVRICAIVVVLVRANSPCPALDAAQFKEAFEKAQKSNAELVSSAPKAEEPSAEEKAEPEEPQAEETKSEEAAAEEKKEEEEKEEE